MASYIGTPTSRIDGVAKVTGAAKYAAEFNVPGLAYGSVVTSTIAKGRITRIDHQRRHARSGRDRRADAREPAADAGQRPSLQGRRGARRVAVPSALRRQDHVQRPADRAGRRRNLGSSAFRGLVGQGGLSAGAACHRPAPPARSRHAGRDPERSDGGDVRAAEAARQCRSGAGRGQGASRGRILCPDRAPQSDGALRLDRDLSTATAN